MKQIRKRLIALLLSSVMILGLLPQSSMAVSRNNVTQNYVNQNYNKIAQTVVTSENRRTGSNVSGYTYVDYTEDTTYVYTSEALHYKYIYGYPDGTVRANDNITRAETAQMLYNLFGTYFTIYSKIVTNQNTATFSDVSKGAWYYDAVTSLYRLGYVSGNNDGTFRPNDYITRAEYAQMVSFVDQLQPSYVNKFTDILGHWAQSLINAAAQKGWISGYSDGTFRPNNLITRAEAMTLSNTAMDRIPDHVPSSFKNPYNDINSTHWAYKNVMEASSTHELDSWHNNTTLFGLNMVTENYVDASGNKIKSSITYAGNNIVTPKINGYTYMGYIKIINYVYSKNSAPSCIVKYDSNNGTGNSVTDRVYNGSTYTVKDVTYTKFSCDGYTFNNWNTKADGMGTEYNEGDLITIKGNITLYAQWLENSSAPVINKICEGDVLITGTGVPKAVIEVLLPNGNELKEIVDAGGFWKISATNFIADKVVSATQTEPGKAKSNIVYKTIEGGTIAKPYAKINQVIVNGFDYTYLPLHRVNVNDKISYIIEAGNNGGTKSICENTVVDIMIPAKTGLDTSSIKINGVTASVGYSPGQYNLSGSNLLLFLDDMAYNDNISISFTVTANEDISEPNLNLRIAFLS